MQTQLLSKNYKNFTRVGWANAEKNGPYKLFPIQDVMSFTLSLIQVLGAILTFNFPPEYGGVRPLCDRGGAVDHKL